MEKFKKARHLKDNSRLLQKVDPNFGADDVRRLIEFKFDELAEP